MKLFLAIMTFGIFWGNSHAYAKDIPELCVKLSDITDFYRCESPEVVCYTSKGGTQCWPKPQARPQVSPTPAVEAPKAKKKK